MARRRDTGDSTATYDDVQTRLWRDGPKSIRDYCPEGPGEAGSGQRRLQSYICICIFKGEYGMLCSILKYFSFKRKKKKEQSKV